MIRGLRRRHRLVWAVLGPILAGLLAAAFLSRPAPPVQESMPDAREYGAGTEQAPPQDETAPPPDEPQ